MDAAALPGFPTLRHLEALAEAAPVDRREKIEHFLEELRTDVIQPLLSAEPESIDTLLHSRHHAVVLSAAHVMELVQDSELMLEASKAGFDFDKLQAEETAKLSVFATKDAIAAAELSDINNLILSNFATFLDHTQNPTSQKEFAEVLRQLGNRNSPLAPFLAHAVRYQMVYLVAMHAIGEHSPVRTCAALADVAYESFVAMRRFAETMPNVPLIFTPLTVAPDVIEKRWLQRQGPLLYKAFAAVGVITGGTVSGTMMSAIRDLQFRMRTSKVQQVMDEVEKDFPSPPLVVSSAPITIDELREKIKAPKESVSLADIEEAIRSGALRNAGS